MQQASISCLCLLECFQWQEQPQQIQDRLFVVRAHAKHGAGFSKLLGHGPPFVNLFCRSPILCHLNLLKIFMSHTRNARIIVRDYLIVNLKMVQQPRCTIAKGCEIFIISNHCGNYL